MRKLLALLLGLFVITVKLDAQQVLRVKVELVADGADSKTPSVRIPPKKSSSADGSWSVRVKGPSVLFAGWLVMTLPSYVVDYQNVTDYNIVAGGFSSYDIPNIYWFPDKYYSYSKSPIYVEPLDGAKSGIFTFSHGGGYRMIQWDWFGNGCEYDNYIHYYQFNYPNLQYDHQFHKTRFLTGLFHFISGSPMGPLLYYGQPYIYCTVAEKGCAFCNIADLLKSVGKNYDPATLMATVRWKDNTGRVDWEWITQIASDVFSGIDYYGDGDTVISNASQLISDALLHCDAVMFSIKHPTEHWLRALNIGQDGKIRVHDPERPGYTVFEPNKLLNYDCKIYKIRIFRRRV